MISYHVTSVRRPIQNGYWIKSFCGDFKTISYEREIATHIYERYLYEISYAVFTIPYSSIRHAYVPGIADLKKVYQVPGIEIDAATRRVCPQ